MVAAYGGLRWAGAAVSYDRPMSQRRLWLPGGEMPSVRDQGQHSSGGDQAPAQYADLEAGGFAQVPVMPKREVCAAGPYDQANRGAGDYAVRLGASG
jgi:hypothetical protein